MTQREYLTPKQVAARLLVTGETVRQYCKRGILRHVQTPGREYRIDPKSVAEVQARMRLAK